VAADRMVAFKSDTRSFMFSFPWRYRSGLEVSIKYNTTEKKRRDEEMEFSNMEGKKRKKDYGISSLSFEALFFTIS